MTTQSTSETLRMSGREQAGNVRVEEARSVLRDALARFHPHIAIASSFSDEDLVVIDLAVALQPAVRVFALDTGRLNPETYECAEAVRTRYGINIEWHFPRNDAVEQLVRRGGLFSFRKSVKDRHECCSIRKVEPLQRALSGLRAWITGMRREQSLTRSGLQVAETDAAHGGIAKINPLAAWSTADVEDYVRRNGLPRNALQNQGYASIGCAPCTRPVKAGEDLRAGRWWWEPSEPKECGLHLDRLMRHDVIC